MMLRDVLSYQSPLYGRRTSQIKLSPLRFEEFCSSYEGKNFEELVGLYSVTGGVPKYMELFDDSRSLMDNIREEILQKGSFLYEEPIFLLEKEVKNTMTYFSIIKVIASGNHKVSDIATVLEVKSNLLSPYLSVLIDLDVIEKRVTATKRYPEKISGQQNFLISLTEWEVIGNGLQKLMSVQSMKLVKYVSWASVNTGKDLWILRHMSNW